MVGPSTNDPSQCRIYITKWSDGALYCHSNFLSPRFGEANKIYTYETIGLHQLYPAIIEEVYEERWSVHDSNQMILDHVNNVNYLFDARVFSQKTLHVDTWGARQVQFVVP